MLEVRFCRPTKLVSMRIHGSTRVDGSFEISGCLINGSFAGVVVIWDLSSGAVEKSRKKFRVMANFEGSIRVSFGKVLLLAGVPPSPLV
jgi:hypothetical protein